jgi:hypothetical protein
MFIFLYWLLKDEMTPESKQQRCIECPFCSGLVGPKIGKMKFPECKARFEHDDRLE